MTVHHTYLVGPLFEYRRYCTQHQVHPGNRHVTHVEGMVDLRGVEGGQIIFLANWRDLPEWREIYNWVLSRGMRVGEP